MDLAVLRDISLIILALEAILFCAIPLVLLYFLYLGVRSAKVAVAPYALRVKRYFYKTNDIIQKGCRLVSEPVIKTEATWVGLLSFWRHLLNYRK